MRVCWHSPADYLHKKEINKGGEYQSYVNVDGQQKCPRKYNLKVRLRATHACSFNRGLTVYINVWVFIT